MPSQQQLPPSSDVHVDVPSPLEAYVPVPNPLTGKDDWEYKGPFTMSDVDAYWDWWFDNGAGGRENMANIYNYTGENLRQNCWGYSLGYGTWVNDPAPIYRDDFTRLANQDWPSSAGSDVIRVREVIIGDTHVVTIHGTDYWRKKMMRKAGICYSIPIGCTG